jgi:phage gp37-like protein
MSLSAEQIQSNFEKHLKIVDTYIGDRKDSVKKLISHIEETYVMAPASGKTWHHNAFAGGYVDHVNRVVEYAVKQSRLYQEMGGTVDYTEEELVFAALFHDLGKLGDGDKENYQPQTDKWRQDKLSEMYTYNSDLDFMLIPDRSLYILQKFGLKVSQKEWLGIRLHDGVFDKANEAYFFSHQESSRQKTSIVSVLHSADYLASKVEYDIWKKNGGTTKPRRQKTTSSSGKAVNSSESLSKMLKNL